MFRFFRSIRNRLISDKKIGRYFLYAIGEIILIVIGIWIALGINNRNTQSKNELASISTLREIQNNILDDLAQIEVMANNYLIVRASKEKLLDFDNPISIKELKTGNIRRIGRFHDNLNNNSNGFENIENQINILPQKFEPLLKDLRFLYVRITEAEKLYSDRLLMTIEDHRNFITKQNWRVFEERNSKISDEEVDFYLNDDSFKGYMMKYELDRFNVFRSSQSYRLFAIDMYNKIDSVLNSQNTKIPDAFLGLSSLEDLEPYLGMYQDPSNENIEKFYIRNNLLYCDRLDDNGAILESKIHRKINDSLFAFRKRLFSEIWWFVKTDDDQTKIVFINNTKELIKLD
jgi:hypothetical protein